MYDFIFINVYAWGKVWKALEPLAVLPSEWGDWR